MRKATQGALMLMLAVATTAAAQPAAAPVSGAPAALPAPALLGQEPPVDGQPPVKLPPPTLLPPETPLVPQAADTAPMLGFADAVMVYESPGRYWTSADFLIWKFAHGPLNFPLVTATTTGGAGGVNTTGTTILFDQSDMNYGQNLGARLTQGMWLDSAQLWGVEADGLIVSSHGIHFTAVASLTTPSLTSTGPPGLPITLFRPFFNPANGTNSSLQIANQTTQTGFIWINSGSNLWGFEANAIRSLHRGPCMRCELLGGYRFLTLTEDLSVFTDSNASGSTGVLPNGQQWLVSDRFLTNNHFHGGQIGTRIEWVKDCLAISMTGKIAVGTTQEIVEIGGVTTSISSSAIGSTPGGFLALPSNSGQFSRNELAYVPQFGATLGYQAGKHCRFYMGYDFLYWSRVVRPGDQVNGNISSAQVPSSPSYVPGGGLVPIPAPIFVARDFWAQGVTLGLQVKY